MQEGICSTVQADVELTNQPIRRTEALLSPVGIAGLLCLSGRRQAAWARVSVMGALAVPLSTDLDDSGAVPYFLWDEPMTVSELRRRLADGSRAERWRLLAKILREARDPEVWRFTSPQEVVEAWPQLVRHLGRRRAFWEYLLGAWEEQGLVGRVAPQ